MFKNSILKYTFFYLIILVILALFIETISFSSRFFLKKENIGFLISFNAEQNKYLKDNCLRMKSDIILSHTHDTKLNCKIPYAEKYDDNFIWYKSKKEKDRKIRILTLGGSTTDGFFYHISKFQTWPYFLNQICNKSNFKCEIINGGVGGYNTSQELLKYLIFSKNLEKFDFIISLNGINELNTSRDLPKELKKKYPYQTKIQYLISKEEKWLIQNKFKIILFPNVLSFFEFKRNYNFNTGYQKLFDKNFITNLQIAKKKDNLDYNIDLWEQNLKYFDSIAKSNKSKFISILQPTMGLDYIKIDWKNQGQDYKMYKEFYNDPLRDETNYFYKKARKKCSNLEYCFDLSEIASPGGKNDLFHNPRHHNEKGNLIIANKIFSIILNNLN